MNNIEHCSGAENGGSQTDTIHEAHVREEEALHGAHVQEEEILHQAHFREEEALHREHEREEEAANEHHERHKHRIEVIIQLPTEKWSHGFPETETVHDVIVAALNHFTDQADRDPAHYQLRRKKGDTPLDPAHTLGSYCIGSGEVLKLIPPDGGGQ